MLRTDSLSRIQMKYIFMHPWISDFTKKLNPLVRGYVESLDSSLNSLGSLDELDEHDQKNKNQFGVIDEEEDTDQF